MSAALDLHAAREAVRTAIAALANDPRTARVELARAERILSEALSEYTPVRPPSRQDMKAVRESVEGHAARVAAELAKGKEPTPRGI